MPRRANIPFASSVEKGCAMMANEKTGSINQLSPTRISPDELIDELVRKAESLGIVAASAQRALESLIDGNHLSDEEAVQISATLFTGWQVAHADELPKGISLICLVDHFKTSEHCMRAVADAGKAYKVELASIVLENAANRGPWAQKSRYNAYMLSDSFERLHSVSRCGHGLVSLWARYFLQALIMCEAVPSSLLAWAADGEGNAHVATCALGQMRGQTQGWPWSDRYVRRRLPQFTEQVLREILVKNPGDVAACFGLSRAIEDQGRYHEARVAIRACLTNVNAQSEDVCHLRHEILQIYRRELRDLKRMNGAVEQVIGHIETSFRADCEELIAIAREHGYPKDKYLKTYALFEKQHGRGEHALELAEQMESRYLSQLVAGMVYNDGMLLREGSPLYDSEKAIDCYINAWKYLQDEVPNASASQRLTVLYQLANALHYADYDGDAIDVCRYGLSLKHEPKLVNLLSRMHEKPLVRVGDEIELPAILDKSLDAERYDCSSDSDDDCVADPENGALVFASDEGAGSEMACAHGLVFGFKCAS